MAAGTTVWPFGYYAMYAGYPKTVAPELALYSVVLVDGPQELDAGDLAKPLEGKFLADALFRAFRGRPGAWTEEHYRVDAIGPESSASRRALVPIARVIAGRARVRFPDRTFGVRFYRNVVRVTGGMSRRDCLAAFSAQELVAP
jgi:hypothetical protein